MDKLADVVERINKLRAGEFDKAPDAIDRLSRDVDALHEQYPRLRPVFRAAVRVWAIRACGGGKLSSMQPGDFRTLKFRQAVEPGRDLTVEELSAPLPEATQ